MKAPVRTRYAGYRFPAEIIGHAVWLYFRFPLGLRMVEELLAARGIIVSHETRPGTDARCSERERVSSSHPITHPDPSPQVPQGPPS